MNYTITLSVCTFRVEERVVKEYLATFNAHIEYDAPYKVPEK